MRVLIIEDQFEKRDKLAQLVNESFPHRCDIVHKCSLRSGLKEIVTHHQSYSAILLDMSMPNFDNSVSNSDNQPIESFAGKEILEQMKLRHISIPVILVTQYSSFEGGSIDLGEISKQLHKEYGAFFKGHVYFNSATDAWKEKLKILLTNREQ